MPGQLQHHFNGRGNLDQKPVTVQLVLALSIGHFWLLRLRTCVLRPPQLEARQKRSARFGSDKYSPQSI
ncbi:hypothetical protein DHODJN_09645 [Methylorubrum extorquens]